MNVAVNTVHTLPVWNPEHHHRKRVLPTQKTKLPPRPRRAVRVTPFHQPYISQRFKNPSIKPSHLSTFVLVLVPPLKTPNPSASYLGFSRFLLHPQTGPVPVPVPGQSGMRGHEYRLSSYRLWTSPSVSYWIFPWTLHPAARETGEWGI